MNAAVLAASFAHARRRTRQVPADPARAVSYLRVSTDRQELGPAAQRAAIATWARSNGVEIMAEFVDRGVSGAADLDDRPGLLAAIAALTAHGAGVMIVAKRDRLARDVVLGGLIERLVQRAGARVRSADGVSDATGAEGQLLSGVVDLFAQFERALIRSRTTAALQAKKAKGERVGGVPWGKRLSRDGVRLLDHPAEMAVIAVARRLHQRGKSLREIAAVLDQRGVCARSGGKLWPESIRAMLRAAP